jgi:hypothetical protein
MPTSNRFLLRPALYACLAAAFVSLAGCAQQRAPGYYATEHDNTYSDAQKQGQGTAEARAPSQIQLGFGEQARKPGSEPARNDQQAAQASEWEAARPLREPKTFLGTVPCLGGPDVCTANRFTLTLAPSGEWRARSVVMGGGNPSGGTTTAQQGCWHIIGTKPLRILLQLNNQNPKASLTFANDNVLRVDSFDGMSPNLDYRLTRQADIDGIDELHGQSAMDCKGR